jgi:carbonic anhydrase/acetyltransferase-like protein (isoleucine patch superfamily)
MPLYSFDGVRPRIARSAYVHPDAVVIGNVLIGAEASVWPAAVLRGDHGSVEVGARTSIQDGTVVHTTTDWPTVIGADCVVGHNAHLEGCVVEDRCLIGSMATVLNRVRVGRGSLVGAGALVPQGLQVPPGSRLLGVPARVEPLPDADDADAPHATWLRYAVETYVQNARSYPKVQQPASVEECAWDQE